MSQDVRVKIKVTCKWDEHNGVYTNQAALVHITNSS